MFNIIEKMFAAIGVISMAIAASGIIYLIAIINGFTLADFSLKNQ